MPRIIRAFACTALISSLAACVVTPPRPRTSALPSPRTSAPPPPRTSAPPPPRTSTPPPPPRTNPHEVADQRFGQINERLDNLGRRIDSRVDQGFYAQPDGSALHHRLDVIRQEAHDMADQHGGVLSGEEQGVLNQELDAAARAIGE